MGDFLELMLTAEEEERRRNCEAGIREDMEKAFKCRLPAGCSMEWLDPDHVGNRLRGHVDLRGVRRPWELSTVSREELYVRITIDRSRWRLVADSQKRDRIFDDMARDIARDLERMPCPHLGSKIRVPISDEVSFVDIANLSEYSPRDMVRRTEFVCEYCGAKVTQ